MAIETAGKAEAEQTQLIPESREERLEKLYQLDAQINALEDDLVAAKAKSKASISSIEGAVSQKKNERRDLLFKLNNRQEIFVPVAIGTQDEDGSTDDEMPSDDELAEFEDEAQAEPEASTVLEEIESLFEPDAEVGAAEPAEPEAAPQPDESESQDVEQDNAEVTV